jgi:hypothetical protein
MEKDILKKSIKKEASIGEMLHDKYQSTSEIEYAVKQSLPTTTGSTKVTHLM